MRRTSEDFVTSKIASVCEQDGNPEWVLREKLASYFVRPCIRCRAYLAKSRITGRAQVSVALCLYLGHRLSTGIFEPIM